MQFEKETKKHLQIIPKCLTVTITKIKTARAFSVDLSDAATRQTELQIFLTSRLPPVAICHLFHVHVPSLWTEWRSCGHLLSPRRKRRPGAPPAVSKASAPPDKFYFLLYDDVLHTTHSKDSLTVLVTATSQASSDLSLSVTSNIFFSAFIGDYVTDFSTVVLKMRRRSSVFNFWLK